MPTLETNAPEPPQLFRIHTPTRLQIDATLARLERLLGDLEDVAVIQMLRQWSLDFPATFDAIHAYYRAENEGLLGG